MATSTTNLSLRKPETSDVVSVALDISGNAQTLDDKWAAATPTAIGPTLTAGSALTIARSDHTHNVGSGAVGAPGLPVGESNTGLYRPGSGQLAATVAGVLAWVTSSLGIVVEKALTLKEIATQATPAAGYLLLQAKTDDKFYKITPGGDEVLMMDTDLYTAAGDTLYFSADETPARLALGTKGYGLLAGASAPLYEPVTRKNVIINGDLSIWQRGSAAPTVADNAYGPDRWRMLTETTTTGFTINRETTDVPAPGSRCAAKFAIGASNNIKGGMVTVIEGADMWHLRGQAASLQFKLKVSDARIGDVRVAFMNWTGTEDATTGDPISAWNAAGSLPSLAAGWASINTPTNISPTTSWVTYKVENQSVSASATNLGVFIWIDDKTTTAGDYMLVTDVQVELGTVCTQFDRRHFEKELLLCQRFYAKTFNYATKPATAAGYLGALIYVTQVAGTGGPNGILWRLPVLMRATPTITTYNPTSANAKFYNAVAAADSATPNVANGYQSDQSVLAYNAQVAGDLVTHQLAVHLTADAEI